MMVEKESGRLDGNEFENLWRKVAQSDCSIRYLLIDYLSLRSGRNTKAFAVADTQI